MARAAIRALPTRPPGRAVAVRADDVFLVSYPKSGNTWLRFLIGSLLARGEGVDFRTIQALVPDIDRWSARALAGMAGPRVLKSHEYLDPCYPRVVYVVRDPRDACISYFHHRHREGGADGPTDAALATHVSGFLDGGLDAYGTWAEHVGGWLGARRDPDRLLLVRYEDMSRDAAGELRRVARFLGLDPAEQAIEAAVERNSFERMREIERHQIAVTGELGAERLKQPFMRDGRSGIWRESLAPELVARIEARFGAVMTDVGYPLATMPVLKAAAT